jgi:hypothetical protein
MRCILSLMAVVFILALGVVACTVGEEEEATEPTATAGRTATPQPSAETAFGAPSACRSLSEGRSDATIIASGILSHESSELLFDSQEFAALSEELERVLSLIRNAYPATASIHARDPYVAGQVMLTVESPLKEAIQNAVSSQPGTTGFVTGQAAFDALTAQLGGVRGLRTDDLQKRGYVLLCLDDRVNVPPASVAYSGLEGVRNVGINWMGGDGPDIDALRDGDTWYVVFRDAWGDCPAGCTEGELYYFTVTDDTVMTVEPAQAAVDPKFASLARWVHGDEIVGIGAYWGQNPVTGEFVIVAPLVDSPAQRAGVRPGDVILAFDGKPASGWTEDDFRARLGGYEGTEVTLNLRHTDGSVEDISFVRAAVRYHAPAQAERIGVELLADTATGVILVNPTPNFPADPTVIRWGDLLLAVNGESTAGWTSIEAADRIDSIQGDHVTITVRHVEGEIEDITVSTRSEVAPIALPTT